MNKDWEAEWIWHETRNSNAYVEFRKSVVLGHLEEPYQLHISASQEYNLFVNGEFIGRGPSPCDPSWQYYDSYEMSNLQAGENVIAVVCYYFGDKDIVIQQQQGEAGFVLQLESNDNIVLTTDESWKCRISPRWVSTTERISRWGGYKEIYLASQEDQWMACDYKDEDWKQAVPISKVGQQGSPWERLIPREIPYLKYERTGPNKIVRIEKNFGKLQHELPGNGKIVSFTIDARKPMSSPSIVFDFEREVVGRPVLLVHAAQGGVLRLAYGESLELQYVDTFILKPGINRLSPFGRRACRFLQVTGMATPEPIQVEALDFELSHYPFETSMRFSSSDTGLNQIWEISKYTTLMNSQDHLEDCPWREKALWVVDALVMGKVIFQVFGDRRLVRKCLLQGARIQNEDGSIPGTGPERNDFLLPDFCAYWLIGVYDYWSYTGDNELLHSLWPNVERVLAWFEAQLDETGLFSNADRDGWWCFIDWTDALDKRDKVTAISCLYYKALQCASDMALAIDKRQYGHELITKRKELKKNIYKHLWIQEKGAFADCMAGTGLSDKVSLQTNFLAIWSGVTDHQDANRFLVDHYDSGKLNEVKGTFFQHIILEVLIRAGRREQAVHLVTSYWGGMIARGATTWWETFDESTDVCATPSTYLGNTPTYLREGIPVSHCHGWGASPGYVIPQLLTGIDLSSISQGYVILHPPVRLVDWVDAEIPTKWGNIRVNWNVANERMQGEITIPGEIGYYKSADYPSGLYISPSLTYQTQGGR